MGVDYKRLLYLKCIRSVNLNSAVIICLLLSITYHIYYYNVWEYIRSTPFVYFEYPLEVDMQAVVERVLNNKPAGVAPMNNKRSFPYVLNADKKCKGMPLPTLPVKC